MEAQLATGLPHGRGAHAAIPMRSYPFRYLESATGKRTELTQQPKHGSEFMEGPACRRLNVWPHMHAMMLTVRRQPDGLERVGRQPHQGAGVGIGQAHLCIIQQDFIAPKYEIHMVS